MDLATKVGQRLIVTFPGPELTSEIAQFIIDCRAAGVILFSHNITNLEQVRSLNRDLQRLAAENGLPPLLISIDEEGGRVTRMPPDGAKFIAPSQMAQGAAGNHAAKICAASTARRLRYLGFNLDYAPVLDVNNNPANPVIGTRSFGSDPAAVAELGVEAIAGFLAENVAPCAKHFPGHGDTDIDSHIGLPVVAKSYAQLQAIELEPFRRAVQAGVPAIMTAHITYPEIEPQQLPATLSPFFLGKQGVLRRELGFNGVIFTDALVMQAICDTYGLEKGSLMALRAGADIVMPLGSIQNQRACYKAMLEAAQRGEFEIETSHARIAAFKERFCLPPLSTDSNELNSEVEITANVARRSVTLVRNRGGLLPLLPGKFQRPLLVHFEPMVLSAVEERKPTSSLSLYDLLSEKLPNLTHQSLPPFFSDEEVEPVVQAASESDAIVILCRNATRFENQIALIKRLLQTGQPTALVAALDPYDLAAFDADALVATYSVPPVSLQALAEVLLGDFVPQGRLPVDIPGLANRGDGLNEF